MANKKDKPTPINREQFLNNLHDPYQLPEQDLQPYDNSNPEAKYTKPGQPEFLRANEISMKGDTSPNIRISLEDHDETILYYLQNNIKPTVEINGFQREVPVIYGSPERWKSIQKDGYYRDKNGKIQTPLIVLKRDSFEKNRSIGNKLDGNKVNNVQYFKQGYSKRNSYDNFSVLQNQLPSVEYKVGIIPDYITITYKLIIFTDYVEHMNKLIEAIEFASDSYWGDKEKFMFRASITSFPTPVVVESGNDRVSRSELTLTVNGYIIPDNINVNQAAPSPKSYNITKLVFKEFFNANQSVSRNVPIGSKRINISNPQSNQSSNIIYYGDFSGSFTGDGSGLFNLPIPSSSINTSSLLTTSSFNEFTSSYILDSSSFNDRINDIIVVTSSFVTFPIFNNFTSSYNTGSFTGSFKGDGSQLTGIISSKWTGSESTISRESNVNITGSFSQGGLGLSNNGAYSHVEGIGLLIDEDIIITPQTSQFISLSSENNSIYSDILNVNNNIIEIQGDLTTGFYDEVLTYLSFDFFDINFNYYPQIILRNIVYDSNNDISYIELDGLLNQYYSVLGTTNKILGTGSHVEGFSNISLGNFSHVEGSYNISSGSYSHVEGFGNITKDTGAHAEGLSTIASGAYSHTEGQGCITYGYASHTEGNSTITNGSHSHAEGNQSKTFGESSHAEGFGSVASGAYSHAEGILSITYGMGSHTSGRSTIASGSFQKVVGQFNLPLTDTSAFIIGNGTNGLSRSNLVFASGSTFQVTGSVISTQGFTGSLFGTSSWAINSSTSSYVLQSVSSSFASTASFIPNYISNDITSSMLLPYVLTSSTSSMRVLSSSFSLTSSFLNPLRQNVVITGSLEISGNINNINLNLIDVTSSIQNQLNERDVLPVLYEKHANVPTFGGSALNNLEGFAFTITGQTARSFADTNAYTRRQRLGLTVTVTGNLAQARQIATYFNRNSNLDIIIGLGFAENCNNANVRVFAGISTTTLFSNVEPTALLNCIGLAKLTTSNNLHLIHNDGSGTATSIDLGVNFPSNTIETDFYILRLKTNGSDIDYIITRVNTGDVASGTLTSDLPSTTTALNLGYYVVQSTGANATTGIDYFGTNIIKY